MEDGEYHKQNKKIQKMNVEQEDNSDPLPNPRNIFQSIRLRRSILSNDELDRGLLDYNVHILLYIAPIFYILCSII